MRRQVLEDNSMTSCMCLGFCKFHQFPLAGITEGLVKKQANSEKRCFYITFSPDDVKTKKYYVYYNLEHTGYVTR